MDGSKWINLDFITICEDGIVNRIYYGDLPALLKNISSPPKSLFFNGDFSLLYGNCLTIIGTRQISGYGRWCIEYILGSFLKDLGIVVVSGLANGVDTYVHETCLSRGIKTIAIVPGSLVSVRSSKNAMLYERIVKEGLILAEYEEGTVLRKEMFVLRNRLLAGISENTIVIEAGLGSGSLITAYFALDFNRGIYAIPGPINEYTSHGCNMLLKQGAGLIAGPEDVKEIFGIHDDQILLKT